MQILVFSRKFPICFFILFSIFPAILSQDIGSILEDHYKAAAQEKMQKVETITTTGLNVYSIAGIESAFKIFQSRPMKLRVESDFQGSKVVQTFNGENGWKYAPAMGEADPVEVKGIELETFVSQCQFENPLWDYIESGASLEISESEEEHTIHLIYTIHRDDVKHFYINKENGLITRIKTHQLLGGSEAEIEVFLEDYKSVKGIPFAHHIITKMNGEIVTTLKIEKVELNRKIDPSLFEKPKRMPF